MSRNIWKAPYTFHLVNLTSFNDYLKHQGWAKYGPLRPFVWPAENYFEHNCFLFQIKSHFKMLFEWKCGPKGQTSSQYGPRTKKFAHPCYTLLNLEKIIMLWVTISNILFLRDCQNPNPAKTLSTLSRTQFHQHFTSSFYARGSQKRKKDSQIKQLFALLGPVCLNAARKHVGEIDPRSQSSVWVPQQQQQQQQLRVLKLRYFLGVEY